MKELKMSDRIPNPPAALNRPDALLGVEALRRLVARTMDRYWPARKRPQAPARELTAKSA
jgi:hypothetical protein